LQILNPVMAGSGIRPSPSASTQGNGSELVNVPSLAEVWKEERERCKELAISTQPTAASHINSDVFPAINPPALQQIWEAHFQVLQEIGVALPATPRTTAAHVLIPAADEARQQETVEDLLGWFHEQAAAIGSQGHESRVDEGLQHRSQESEDALSQPEPHAPNFSQDEVRCVFLVLTTVRLTDAVHDCCVRRSSRSWPRKQ
jgi:hypothetical protein